MRNTITMTLFTAALLSPRAAPADEPSVDQVRAAALAYTQLDGNLDRWSARSRWRNLLPKVTAKVGHLDQLDENVAFDEFLARDDDGSLLFDGAHNGDDRKERDRLYYEVRATIDFRGLLFDDAEMRAASEERQRLRDRLEVIEAVHEAYFARLAAGRKLEAAPTDERRVIALEIIRHEATLDGLTGGWFRRALEGGAQ